MRHRRLSASLLAGTAAALAAIVLTPPAFALEPGVQVSPGSPAGIEYAFPLGSTRGELSGQRSNPSVASTYSPPLFGVGVTRGGVRGRSSAKPAPAGAAAQARRLDQTVQAGSQGDLAAVLVGGVLLVGVLVGVLGRRALGA